MADAAGPIPLPKLRTEIPGFDLLAEGGFPAGHSILLAGTAGSGKTVFGMQYLLGGLRAHDEPGVLVSFEEGVPDILSAAASLGWQLQPLVDAGQLVLIDASPLPEEDLGVSGSFDLGGILARIESAVAQVGAKRVVLDSAGALIARYLDTRSLRAELQRVVERLKGLGTTPLLTVDREREDGQVTRHGVEEYVTDSVVILRNRIDAERRRRTVEILKFRGASHATGEFPVTIDADKGLRVSALSQLSLDHPSSSERVSCGVTELDAMFGGGLFEGSVALVSGATGTGKTLLATHFVAGGVNAPGPVLWYAFEESRQQLLRNAAAWGIDLEEALASGRLIIASRYPESAGLEAHGAQIKAEVEAFQPKRVAIDSLSALERLSSYKAYRQFLLELTHFLKRRQCTALLTNTSHLVTGAESATDTQISTVTDAILLLRYIELHGELRRGLNILKMRGSGHEKRFHEYQIGERGIEIGAPLADVSGILSGQTRVTERRSGD